MQRLGWRNVGLCVDVFSGWDHFTKVPPPPPRSSSPHRRPDLEVERQRYHVIYKDLVASGIWQLFCSSNWTSHPLASCYFRGSYNREVKNDRYLLFNWDGERDRWFRYRTRAQMATRRGCEAEVLPWREEHMEMEVISLRCFRDL